MLKLSKRPRFIYFYMLIGFITLVGCSKEGQTIVPEVEDRNLVFETFVFEKKNNPHLSEDIVFDITNNVISGELKTYFFNSIPTFSTN